MVPGVEAGVLFFGWIKAIHNYLRAKANNALDRRKKEHLGIERNYGEGEEEEDRDEGEGRKPKEEA